MKCTECRAEVKPIVAIDIDGTLGRYHDQLLHFFEVYFDRPFPRSWDGSGNWEDYLGLERREYQEAKLAFRQGGNKRWMPIYPGAYELCEAATSSGAEVWITTTRPYLRLDSVDPDTRFWLEKNFIYYDHLLYDDDKYSKLLSLVGPGRVVAVVEDLPDQFMRATTVFGPDKAILVARLHNTAFRNSFMLTEPIIVSNLVEAQERVVKLVSEWRHVHA